MDKTVINLLVIEDNPADYRILQEALKDCVDPVFKTSLALRLDEGLDQAGRCVFDAVILDINLPDSRGLEGLDLMLKAGRGVPVILMTGADDESLVLKAIRFKASDYLVKGKSDAGQIRRSIRYAIERRRVEDELLESKERYRTLLGNLPGVTYRCELKAPWKVEFISEGVLTVTGWTESDFMKDDPVLWGDLVFPEDVPGVDKAIEEGIARKGAYEIEYRIRHKEGSVRWVHEKGRAIYGSDQTPLFLDGVIIDISERKRAEIERETSVRFLQLMNESRETRDLIREAVAFFQHVTGCEAVGIRLREGDDYPYYETRGFPEAFVLAETRLCARDAGGNILRDAAFNPVMECMCGNVICGRFNPSKPFFSKHGSFWSNNTTQLLSSTTDEERQARTRNRCNGEGYESVALIPLHVGGSPIGLLQLNDKRAGMFNAELVAQWERLADYLAVAIEKLRLDDAIRENASRFKLQAENLERANKELEAFSYSVSHDLRNPLNAVLACTEVLGMEAGVDLSADAIEALGHITESANRMAQVITDLMTLSNISRRNIRIEKTDLSEAAGTFLRELAVSNPDRDFRFSVTPGIIVNGDPGLLRMMLENLLRNAWKFSANRTPAIIEFSLMEKDGRTCYVVRDNGVGFDGKNADQLFKPYKRLHTQQEFKGSGIGLAIVKRIVSRHGGEIWAQSEKDKGAAFYFQLP